MSEHSPVTREDFQLADNEQWVEFPPAAAVPYIKQRNRAEAERDGAIEWLYNTEKRLDNTLAELGTDSMTGLANRRRFDRDLESVLQRSARVGLLYIDLDNFKRVNDTFGHNVGNDALRFVAKMLKESLRPTDIVARLYGDEFAVIIPDIHSGVADEKDMTDEDRMGAVATRLHHDFMLGLESSDEHKRLLQAGLGASIGWAVYEPGEPTKDFETRAEQLMYANKPEGDRR